MKYLIIGGGIAGTTTAEELRKLNASADITILSNEHHPLYSRVVLPQYVMGKVQRERVFLKSNDWYATQNIQLVFDEVIKLDTDNKLVTTKANSYEYDKLMIAGGGITNSMSFIGHENILHFQSLEDADAILKLANTLENKESKPVIGVIGGGLISMEFVNIFSAREFEIHIFLRKNRFFSNNYDTKSSQILENHLASHGIIVHKNVEVKSFKNNIVQLSDGSSMELDALMAGVGLSSNFTWAKNAGVNVNKGIVCNEFMETNIANIYTAGDCAEYFDTVTQKHVRLGNWMNAIMQSRAAAKTMHGERTPYELVSSSAIKVLGMDVIIIGSASMAFADEIHEDTSENGRILTYSKDKQIIGAALINRTSERMKITDAIKARNIIS